MPSTARIWLILGAISISIPLIFGLVAYGVVRHRIVAKYDYCVQSLPEEQRRTRGLSMIVDDLRRLDRFGQDWNVNAPYRSGSLNILIPTGASDAWHAQCGLPTSPADCLAAATGSFIICNALVGRQLSHPLLVSGIAREEIERARRFLALTIVGHEIGHLQAGYSGRVQHLFPTRKANGLRCRQRNDQQPTEEERADEFGIGLACDAIRSDPTRSVAPDVRSAVDTMSAFRNALDEDLFAFDDSCAGDDTYPSMSRRKSTFALAYARCLYPGADLPYASLATDQDAAFRRLEQWLRSRQVGGFVASSEYGASPVYRFDVASTPSRQRFMAFDSSGITSQISMTTIGDKQVRHDVLTAWKTAGTLVGSHSDASTTEFLASFAAPNDGRIARHVTVRCKESSDRCDAGASEKVVEAGFDLWQLNDKAIAATRGRQISSYASYDDYMHGDAALHENIEFDLGEDNALIAGNADKLLLGSRPADDEIASGFHQIGIVTRAKSQWLTFTTVGTTMSPLRAVGLIDSFAAFVFESSSVGSDDRAQLWLCPVAELEAATTRVHLECDLYRAPDDLSYSVGLANNDLESLGTKVMSFEYCNGLIGVRRSGWLWLVDPINKRADAVPGTGLISCTADHSLAFVYRARRVDEVRLSLANRESSKASIGFASVRGDP
ncbi:hypothetical protein JQ594_00820 [Bradyrhizobium manausense]|uniref:hypothetical protein n=1 Tax=Bradyrhizobium manausense TaxID=989370 RepID=UPI001BAC41BA|nr:hypothetical protein [Bradyrhizobium manausense]MBR0684442.1 hypothetical protein [Bradyrhizobium manausense]